VNQHWNLIKLEYYGKYSRCNYCMLSTSLVVLEFLPDSYIAERDNLQEKKRYGFDHLTKSVSIIYIMIRYCNDFL
jgi:hypothetical protein